MARILVIEDDPASLDLAVRIARHAGHDVVSAADGRAAVDLAAATRPQLILLDLNLPSLDGWTVAATVRASSWSAGVRIVAVSASAMPWDQDRARSAGCDEFLAKPYAPAELRAVIARQLAQAPRKKKAATVGRSGPASAGAR